MKQPSISDFFTGDVLPEKTYLVYGEDKAGKTSLALTTAAKTAARGMKTMWIDCGARLSPLRLKQIIPDKFLDKIYVTQPRGFREQLTSILNIHDFLPSDVSLIVVDDFTNLHRLELTGKPSIDLPVYRALSLQAALLKNIATTRKTAVIIIGLVHEIPVINVTTPVAQRIVTYWTDLVAKTTRQNNKYVIEEEKPANRKIFYKITEKGVEILPGF
ncbi:MAG: hypothetical protein QXF45_05040 [Candidatus Caldarchaeum sp.]